MNADARKAMGELNRRTPFWACLAVFLVLGCEHGMRLMNLVEQHQQLERTRLLQEQNAETLLQAKQLGERLQSLSLDLLQISKTNAVAQQIVRDFGIRWTPDAVATPVPEGETRTPKK